MAVMAAGVHPARDARRVREIVSLMDVQCVHVGAKRDRLAAGHEPLRVPITPVRAILRSTAMPNDSSSRATASAVRCSAKAVSG